MLRRLLSVMLVATFAAPMAAQTQSDFRWERVLPAGNEVSIHNISGNIKVTASTTGKVEVVGVKHGSSRYFDRIKADVQQTSRGVTICVLYDDNDTCDDRGYHSNNNRRGRDRDRDWNDVSMSLEVAVPTNLLVSASSVSGDVTMSGSHGDVEASSVSGDIRLEKLHASGVSAHTVSGNVEVQVDEFTGRGDLSFNSVSGDVSLEAPRGFEADISMSTVSGDINSDFPLTLNGGRMGRRGLDARIGAGGRRFEVRTVSGNLRLRMAK